MEKQEGRGVLHTLWAQSELPMTLGVVGGGSGPSPVSGSCVYRQEALGCTLPAQLPSKNTLPPTSQGGNSAGWPSQCEQV